MRTLVIALLALCSLAGIAAAEITLTPVASYETGIFDEGATEISDFCPMNNWVYSVNGHSGAIDVIDLNDPENPTYAFSIDLSPWGAGANSVAVKNGVVAAAVEAEISTDPGRVVFFDTNGNYLNDVAAGALPDMLMFTPDGNFVLVACEGEPDDDYLIDPVGSLTIVEFANGAAMANAVDVPFSYFDGQEDDLRAQGVRIFGPGASAGQDLEPEYVTYNPTSGMAYVTCQENNAVVVVDVLNFSPVAIVALGTKDHMMAGHGLDASDRDDMINIANWPVKGYYMPDGMAHYTVDGNFYLISANEGDTRDYDGYSEEERIKDLTLDPVAFPDAATLQEDENLGRLLTTVANGDTDGDGDYDELYSIGGRSFSIWNQNGELVWDSGDEFEQITATLIPGDFNSNNDENGSFDSRSDAKGPEPEDVAVTEIDGTWYAIIGMERIGGIFLYNITDPTAPEFLEYATTRDFTGDAEAGTAGGLGPEGIKIISREDSPVGQALVLVSNEVSGSIDIFLLDELTVGIDGDEEQSVEETELPAFTQLSKVYPNPFNPTTNIAFAVSRDMDVTLEVLDVRGRLVDTLINGVQTAGNHNVTWTANEQASGVYFARLTTQDGVHVKRLTLVK